jgi:hypothetical protein
MSSRFGSGVVALFAFIAGLIVWSPTAGAQVWQFNGLSNAFGQTNAFAFNSHPAGCGPVADADLGGPFLPNFAGGDFGVQIDSWAAVCKDAPVKCPTIADGLCRMTINGIGTPWVVIQWVVHSGAYHGCPDVFYDGNAMADFMADVLLDIVGVPPGTLVSVNYAFEMSSLNDRVHEGLAEDLTNVDMTRLRIQGAEQIGGALDIPDPAAPDRLRRRGAGFFFINAPGPVNVFTQSDTDAQVQDPPFVNFIDQSQARVIGWLVLCVNGSQVLNTPPPPPPGFPPNPYNSWGGEFSIDIGSDAELSDPTANGNELFDPGDAYPIGGLPLPPGGANGVRNDYEPLGSGGWITNPDPPPPPTVPAPVCSLAGPFPDVFDLDALDTLDFSLAALIPPAVPLAAPIPQFDSNAVWRTEHLLLSFDDDGPVDYAFCDTPETSLSPILMEYGQAANDDEIMTAEVDAVHLPGATLVELGLMDERRVHTDLAPDPPGPSFDADDDVDALDIAWTAGYNPIWIFSADHEAPSSVLLVAGHIYETVPGGGYVQAVDATIHLGLAPGTDIDAVELLFAPDPNTNDPVLTLVFSVADDDPFTLIDESGGLSPNKLYGSFMTGFSFDFVMDDYLDDIDAIASWWWSLQPRDKPCPGDVDGDRRVDNVDLQALLDSWMTMPPDPRYNPWVDFNRDGKIDNVDLQEILDNWMRPCP